MDKDTKTLVLALFIVLLVGVIGFMFKGYTGHVSGISDTRIELDNDVVKAGEYIRFTIFPGEKGVYKNYGIYDDSDMRRAHSKIQCGSYKCRKTVRATYKTWSSWEEGIYHIKIFDYTKKDYIIKYFTIV